MLSLFLHLLAKLVCPAPDQIVHVHQCVLKVDPWQYRATNGFDETASKSTTEENSQTTVARHGGRHEQLRTESHHQYKEERTQKKTRNLTRNSNVQEQGKRGGLKKEQRRTRAGTE